MKLLESGSLPPQNLEAERFVLASLLANNHDTYTPTILCETLQEADFTTEANKQVFLAAQKLVRAGKKVDTVTVANALVRSKSSVAISDVVNLDTGIPALANLADWIEIVREKARLREFIPYVSQLLEEAYSGTESSELIARAAQVGEKMAALSVGGHGSLKSLADVIQERGINEILKPVSHAGIETPIPWLSRQMRFVPKEFTILAARPSEGKAQPKTRRVLLANGEWTDIGKLRVGDRLASPDGESSNVVALHERGDRQVYNVEFSDGRSTEACAEHLWEVNYRTWERARVLSTLQIAKKLECKRYKKRLSIPVVTGDFGSTEALPIDPYVFGCLLGDGNTCGNSTRFTSADPEVVGRIQARLGELATIKRIAGSYAYSIITAADTPGVRSYKKKSHFIKKAFLAMGIAAHIHHEKKIPAIYLQSTRENRLELLRGLMDTDGWVQPTGTVCFSSSSSELAKGVQTLVRSLGGLCKIARSKKHYVKNGERILARDAYRCWIRHAQGHEFFAMARKVTKATRTYLKSVTLTVKNIAPSRVVDTMCITVSHPRGLYITDDHIVTHNSALALQCAVEAARRRYRVAFYSLEMANEKNASRLISQRAEVNMARLRSGEALPDEWAMVRESLSEDEFEVVSKYLLFSDRGLVTIPHVIADLQAAQMSGEPIQFVILDYIQLMTGVGKFDNRAQEVSSISRGCKLISQNFSIPLLALSQLRRESDKESRAPRLSDLKESGSLEQDATNVLALHRKSDFNEPIWNTDLLALKLRDNATDKCMLNFIRRYTKFVEAAA